MAEFLKDKTMKYLNKDFDGFRRDLMKFAEAHHSGVLVDKNESSPAMALIELNAYIGDALAFYIDQSFSELKFETARQEKNVVSFAKSLGYRPKGKRAAQGVLHFVVEVPAAADSRGNLAPDESYSPNLLAGAQAIGPNGTVFETLEQLSFDDVENRAVTGSRFDSITGQPTHFALRKPVDIIAGKTVTDTFSIGDFEQFKTIELAQEDVIEILSVFDSDGNEWFEVDYLSQDTVFDSESNLDSDSGEVPYILKFKTVPRRFITDRDPESGRTSLIFGSGDGVTFDDKLIPNLADMALPLAGRSTFTTFELDPQNFLKTRSLGLSPFNTVIDVNYRVVGGETTNVPAGSIRVVTNSVLTFGSTSLNTLDKSAVQNSIECVNLLKTDGGGAAETISEIKSNSAAHFASQRRVVTREDFIARILTLPEKFGKPEKVFIKRSNVNELALDIHLLSKDDNGHLCQASQKLKTNISNYIKPLRMLTDGVNLLDSDIINLKLNFGIVVAAAFNRSEILMKCLSILSDYLDIDKRQIGEPIILSDISAELQNVYGVISVYELKFTTASGLVGKYEYSSTRFNLGANTNNNIIYCPENAIFEVKFLARDISGVAK